MKKRFVSKRAKSKLGTKIIGLFLIALFSFSITFHLLVQKMKDDLTKEEILQYLFDNGIGKNDFLDFLEMNPTEFLFSNTMGIKLPKSESVFEESEETGPTYSYVPDPSPSKEAKDPIIYIYNTHQTEGYSKEGISEYDIVPTVLFASYYLREKLNDYGLPTMVETNDISEILRVNQWSYGSSYKASRYLLLDAIAKHQNLAYFLDIHRDSISHEASTTEYNGKKYAKVLFVIGKEHQNYEKNLDFATKINEKMKLKVNTISRGVIGKEGQNVNGIYNQDVSPNAILIEVGGQYNNIAEVTNTMEVIALSLKEYMEENS